NAQGGFAMTDTNVASGGESYVAGFVIDPELSLPDDYSNGGVRIEVYARVMLSAAFTGGVTITLSAGPEAGGATIYTPEFGLTGRSVAVPSSSNNDKWRWTRLGTLDLPAGPATSGRWIIAVV